MIQLARTTALITGVVLVAACASGDGPDAIVTPAATVTPTAPTVPTVPITSPPTPEVSTTDASAPAPTSPERQPPPVVTAPDGSRLLDFAFQPVPPDRYLVETIGAPFRIDVPEGWWVQPNDAGHFVLTDATSSGPGDRDIVMIRPTDLADPGQPHRPVDEQRGWPLDDIEGWLDALVPGVQDGEPVETTIGGLDAIRFDVELTDEVECGIGFCVGFATNQLVNSMTFDRRIRYRVWWIDGGAESPIAIFIGDGADPTFTERAEAVLATLEFEEIGPNPIPTDRRPWEIGLTTESVPPGVISVPFGPGLTFETTDRHFIFQRSHFMGVVVGGGEAESDFFVPDEGFDGRPVATVDDLVDVVRDYDGYTAEVEGVRTIAGNEATVVRIEGPGPDANGTPMFTNSADPDDGWWSPVEGTLWVMERDDGLLVFTAEVWEVTSEDEAYELAEQIIATLVIGS